MMQATENWEGDHSSFASKCRPCMLLLDWDPLLNALMWSCLIEVDNVLLEHVAQVPFPEDQQVIEAFAAQAPYQPLADRILLTCQQHQVRRIDHSSSK